MSNLPFGLGYGDVGKNHITEFPSIPLPINGPITNKERSLAVKYINFGKTVKDGPFYTGSMSLIIDQQENSKSGKRKPNIILDEDDTNDGIERYSDKYLKKRKIGISIDDHPYNLNLFPNELYNVMGINKKKLLAISKFNNADDVFTGTGLQDENIGLSMLAKLKELAEDVDDASTGDGAAKEVKQAKEKMMIWRMMISKKMKTKKMMMIIMLKSISTMVTMMITVMKRIQMKRPPFS